MMRPETGQEEVVAFSLYTDLIERGYAVPRPGDDFSSTARFAHAAWSEMEAAGIPGLSRPSGDRRSVLRFLQTAYPNFAS